MENNELNMHQFRQHIVTVGIKIWLAVRIWLRIIQIFASNNNVYPPLVCRGFDLHVRNLLYMRRVWHLPVARRLHFTQLKPRFRSTVISWRGSELAVTLFLKFQTVLSRKRDVVCTRIFRVYCSKLIACELISRIFVYIRFSQSKLSVPFSVTLSCLMNMTGFWETICSLCIIMRTQ